MTEYEKLSLALLQSIANGVALMLVGPNMQSPDAAAEHAQNVLEFQRQLARLTKACAGAPA